MSTELREVVAAEMREHLNTLLRRDSAFPDIAEHFLGVIPNDWAKVDGEWHHIPDEHFIKVKHVYKKSDPGYRMEAAIDWRMEHSLPCRIRGMDDCPVQEVWEAHLEEEGRWPNEGRYRIWLEGDFIRSAVEYAHGTEEVIEDGRTIHWESDGG